MDKSAIKNFSIEARKILMETAKKQAGLLGITKEDGIAAPLQKGLGFEIYPTPAGTEIKIFDDDIKRRRNLVTAIDRQGYDQVIEETAYTWFNRLIAIRFMEVNHYLPTRTRVLSSETGGNTPDLVTQFLDVDLGMSAEEIEKVQTAKEENRYDDAFAILFVRQCNELNAILPGLFEKTNDYMELLLKLTYTGDGVVRMLVDTIPEDNFDIKKGGQVEIIGWLYQYYNTELKDDTFAKLKKNVKISKERIPAATQLFTPDWIVRYMVENSLGRLWIEGHPNETLKANWKYYLEEAKQEDEVEVQLAEIRKEYAAIRPEEIKCMDCCMGSGHILCYFIDVLMQIYESEGYGRREAIRSILKNNLYGLDIDERAYQLAYFSVMMKAREYDRKILTSGIKPHVYAIPESNGLSKQWTVGNEQMAELFEVMGDAKEYGSIINVPQLDFGELRESVSSGDTKLDSERMADGIQMSFEDVEMEKERSEVLMLIDVAELLAQKYHVIDTNPPYMGNMPVKMTEYVRKYYKNEKYDLYAVFVKKCRNFGMKHSRIALITQQAWMFLSSFEKFRKDLNNSITFMTMIQLGARAFDEIGGEVVQTTAFTFLNSPVEDYTAIYKNLTDGQSQNEKEMLFELDNNIVFTKQKKFSLIPGYVYAYWISDNTVSLFSKRPLSEYVTIKSGIVTGNNKNFLKLWVEINFQYIGFHHISFVDGANVRWVPMHKGGGYRKHYGLHEYVMNLHDIWNPEKTNVSVRRGDPAFYFKEGLTWSTLSNNLSVRKSPTGFVFDTKGSMCFVNDINMLPFFEALLNSTVASYFMSFLSPTLDFNQGAMGKIPVLIPNNIIMGKISEISDDCVYLARQDWDSFETSWDFKQHPLVRYKMSAAFAWGDNTPSMRISAAYKAWEKVCSERFNKLKENEEKLNLIFIDIYGLQDELTPEVEDKDVTVRKADYGRDIRSLISYAVGCMFGRYSLDVEGLAYAGGDWDDSKYSSFTPDPDNVIPITDEDYFSDDIVMRFCEWLKVVYGADTLEENLDFIANALGNKGNTSRDVIRNYFLKDFYKDHCKIYQKRPIYWLFDSGKQNGFKALIYMHRYERDTVGRIRADYLHKMQDAITGALKNAEYVIETSAVAVDRAKASKDKDRYLKQLNEIRVYYPALSSVALQRIEIDLDDGVKNNYELFQNIEVFGEAGKKQKVNLLARI